MYNLKNNSLFSNPYLPKNPSNINNTLSGQADDINALYSQLEALKAQRQSLGKTQQAFVDTQHPQQNSVRTVYTDIAELWESLSADEQRFVETSQEYQQANIEYQNAFNSFLLERFGNEFLSSKHGKVPEKILSIIKTKKEEYQNNLTNDISTIKSQNELLLKQNSELSKNNEEMGRLIKSLQDQLWVQK